MISYYGFDAKWGYFQMAIGHLGFKNENGWGDFPMVRNHRDWAFNNQALLKIVSQWAIWHGLNILKWDYSIYIANIILDIPSLWDPNMFRSSDPNNSTSGGIVRIWRNHWVVRDLFQANPSNFFFGVYIYIIIYIWCYIYISIYI